MIDALEMPAGGWVMVAGASETGGEILPNVSTNATPRANAEIASGNISNAEAKSRTRTIIFITNQPTGR
ncbi:hypothetical protein [Stieleria marina]|uniref:hypothetical protein n=1 Tax=Stieleria marina TaxID=1930275 RepID=UPI003AF3D41F